jgi:hypothetical protein
LDGVLWSGVQTVLGRIVTFGGQLLLAYLLAPADFGLFAMATAGSAIILQFQSLQMRSRRHGRRGNVPSKFARGSSMSKRAWTCARIRRSPGAYSWSDTRCGFRSKPATCSELMSAIVPI